MRTTTTSAALLDRIRDRSARVGFVGLGYVGLSEAIEFAHAGFPVTGFDIQRSRVEAVGRGRSYLSDLPDAELTALVDAGRLTATDRFAGLGEMDAVLICVPTPLGKTKAPDLSYILSAVQLVRWRLRRGQLVVLESTSYPGTTREVVLPALASAGLAVGRDFHLAFSPERINPGDRASRPSRVPKIVGGVTPGCTDMARALYAQIAPEVVVVSSPEAAEMVKLLENTFRAVNIGLANEIALMCRALGLDVWEIIDAAATKPFGFMPFYPGPGLGGHCIPIDPLYLGWKARVNGFEPRFIDLAHQINSQMPRFVVSLLVDALNRRALSLHGSTILILGVSYKRDVSDARESPATVIIPELRRRGVRVLYHDPHVPRLDVDGAALASVPLTDAVVREASCVLVLTDHGAVDYKRVVELAAVVVDTRNATRDAVAHRDKVIRL
jgi:UDP-N-acetyl-D-glucosamine dehydrogenase